MVSNYIILRLRQFVRFYSFSDIHPLLGIPATAVIFAVLSAVVYHKAPYAHWVYCGLTLLTVTELQNAKTNSFLKQMLTRNVFFRVKLAENLLLLLPFAMVMVYYNSWLQLLAAVAFTLPYSYSSAKLPKPQLKALGTPYSGYAYEANFGFRAMFAGYVLYALLLVAGCIAQNVYVLMVPFFILLFCMVAAYGELEEPVYIWTYRATAGGFLKKKFYTLLRNYSITFAPFLLLGLVFCHREWAIVLLCFGAGLVALTGAMLIKYHFYPGRVVVQITQMLFFGCAVAGLAIPPMLGAALLFLFFSAWRARANLKTILQC